LRPSHRNLCDAAFPKLLWAVLVYKIFSHERKGASSLKFQLYTSIITSAPGRTNCRDEYGCSSVSLFVCLSASALAYVENYMDELQQISVHVDYGRGSILLWRHCDTLCTSGFVDDVIFLYNTTTGTIARYVHS